MKRFTDLSDTWWDVAGPFRPLHEFNPVRVGFIRDTLCAEYDRDPLATNPLDGLKIADIGCGGGLLCEPLARLGATITGIDPGADNIGVARLHAEQMGLDIDYRQTSAEEAAQTGDKFDVILTMEVLEHVADIYLFIDSCGILLNQNGMFIGATINRTAKSLALAKIAVEYVLRLVPVGTHEWEKFVTPAELARALREAGLQLRHIQGVTYNPLRGSWRLSDSTDINYIIVAGK